MWCSDISVSHSSDIACDVWNGSFGSYTSSDGAAAIPTPTSTTPPYSSYNDITNEHDWTDVLEVHSTLEEHIRNGDMDSADAMIGKMCKRLFLPTIELSNMMIDAAIPNSTSPTRYSSSTEAATEHDRTDVLDIHATLEGYIKNGDMDKADAMIFNMCQRLFSPTIELYNMLIGGHVSKGDMYPADQYFQRMTTGTPSVQPDALTYRLMLGGYAQQGDVGTARRLFQRFQCDLLPDSEITWTIYEIMIELLLYYGDLDHSARLYQIAQQRPYMNWTAMGQIYQLMRLAFVAARQLDKASEVSLYHARMFAMIGPLVSLPSQSTDGKLRMPVFRRITGDFGSDNDDNQ